MRNEKYHRFYDTRMFASGSILILLTLFLACESQTTPSAAPFHGRQVQFEHLDLPATHYERSRMRASSWVTVDGRSYRIDFQELVRTGDVIGNQQYGRLPVHDSPRNFIRAVESPAEHTHPMGDDLKRMLPFWKLNPQHELISGNADFTSLLSYDDRLFAIGHLEEVPAAVYISNLHQDARGRLSIQSTRPLDFGEFEGTYNACAGSVTPWGSHLGSEEYDPDARRILADGSMDARYNDQITQMSAYFSGNLFGENPEIKINPYRYGWIPEIEISNAHGQTRIRKHYAMGRFSHELAYVMPDRRTVYLTDDGAFTGFFMFIADHPGNLSAGTLYAARWSTEARGNVTSTNSNQNAHTVNNQTGDSGRLQWISLGHARSSEIEAALGQTRFTDLFKLEPVADGRCPTGTRPFLNANIINTRYWRTDVPSVELECLRLFDVRMKSVDSAHFRRVASRLESRRYAAHLGATTEFHKMEGIAHDNRHEKLYVAFASLSGGMLPLKSGDAGYHHRHEIDHIRLPQAQRCGGIYALQLKADQTDSDGRPMDSAYVAVNMRPELLGRGGENGVNDCDPNTIAGPDNLTFIPGADLLIVAEDNDDIFRNDMVWTYRVTDPKPESAERKLTRIVSVPYGAEATSTYFYDNYHGYAYLMVVAQKPYGKTLSRYADRMRTGAVQFPPRLRGEYRELYELLQKPIPEEYKGAIIGTIGPIPVASLPAMPEDAP